jgi:Ca2+-transporting ATPase
MKDFLSLQLGETNVVTPYEQTLLFSIFVWTHFWYMFNARSFGSNSSFFKLEQSTGFVSIVGVIVIGQIVIVELLYEFFNVQPMFHTLDWQFNLSGFVDWLTIVGLSSFVLWVREIWHFITKK